MAPPSHQPPQQLELEEAIAAVRAAAGRSYVVRVSTVEEALRALAAAPRPIAPPAHDRFQPPASRTDP